MKNSAPKKGFQTILWWVIWITLTIVSFFVAAAIWTPIIANKYGSMQNGSAAMIWVTAVFGTWMIFLVPLIIFMYSKVDKAYEDARMKREKDALRFRSIEIDREKRLLAENLSTKLKEVPQTIEGGHLVTVKLKDGKAFEHVFVQHTNEIMGIYNEREMPFQTSDIEDIVPTDLSKLPAFQQNKWLRLDGVANPELAHS